jgi:hypothetical protein
MEPSYHDGGLESPVIMLDKKAPKNVTYTVGTSMDQRMVIETEFSLMFVHALELKLYLCLQNATVCLSMAIIIIIIHFSKGISNIINSAITCVSPILCQFMMQFWPF